MKIGWRAAVAVNLALYALTSALTIFAPGAASAGEPEPPAVTMRGQGVVRAVPDLATLTLAVRTEAPEAGAALSQNSAQMRTLLAAIDATGIAKEDVATAVVTLEPRFVYPDDGKAGPKVEGYVARNALTVRVRDLVKLGPLLQGAVAAGSNDLSGLAYDFVDRRPLLDRARIEAVADARRKAEAVALAAGIKLGRVLRITEDDDRGGPMPRAMLADAKGGAVPVEAGTQEVGAGVSITWEIAP